MLGASEDIERLQSIADATGDKVMRIISGKSVVAIALLLVLLATSLPSCGGGAPSLPVQVELSFSDPPVLGKPVEFTATFNLVTSVREIAHDVDAKIILSEGFELVDGDTEWQGDFILGQSHTMSVTIKAIKMGTWKIGASAGYSPGEGAYEGGAKALYVTVTEESATISDRPPFEVPTPVQTDPPAE